MHWATSNLNKFILLTIRFLFSEGEGSNHMLKDQTELSSKHSSFWGDAEVALKEL